MPLDLSVIGKSLPETTYEYGDTQVMLYALGVGCTTRDELDFVYEKNLKVLPTFAVIPAFASMMGLGSVLDVNWAMLLHGEQRIELRAPIPANGKLTTQATISAIYDKGSGALMVIDAALILQFSADILHRLNCPEAADVNANGTVNPVDAALVLQFIAGILDTL